MAIGYTWDVSTVNTYPTKSSKSDVIYSVHWRLEATDGSNNDADGNPQTALQYGQVDLDTSDLSGFIAFASVTKSNVQSWAEAALGSDKVTEIKALLDATIAEKVTPTSVTKTIG